VSFEDKEQFPSLSSSKAPVVQTKLNFKEMVMKSVVGGATTTTTTTTGATTTTTGATTNSCYHRPLPRPSLSSGNIFLGAFVEHDSGNGSEDGEMDCGMGGANVTFSSILVDSCDGKYDKLYR
jgi:hypothetical protein